VTITASLALQPTAKVPALLPILIKGGLNQATRGLALELAGANVKVNAVAPGIIKTRRCTAPTKGTQDFLKQPCAERHHGHAQDVVTPCCT
jgi:NAD(P)-dependent dehydrogenase (short-subunit alcohol dehydrogenase family)